MTDEQIIKAVAELDGWKQFEDTDDGLLGVPPKASMAYPYRARFGCGMMPCPKYATSYDAIIPVIKKQKFSVRQRFFRELRLLNRTESFGQLRDEEFLFMSPRQLCVALVKALGKNNNG